MKNILIFCVILLSGCSLLPVTQKFPAAEEEMMQKCESLTLIDKPEVKLSELTTTIVKNYRKYHNCADLVEAWQDWYTKQKKIFEEANE